MALTKEWTTPTEIGATDPMTATLFNEKLMQNMMYLIDKPYDEVIITGGTDWDTTSTTPVVIDSSVFDVSIDVVSGLVEVQWSIPLRMTANDYAYFNIRIDDDYLFGDVPSGGVTKILQQYRPRDNGTDHHFIGKVNISGLSVGTHSFEPMVWVGGGTMTVYQASGYTGQFSVREI